MGIMSFEHFNSRQDAMEYYSSMTTLYTRQATDALKSSEYKTDRGRTQASVRYMQKAIICMQHYVKAIHYDFSK